MVNLRKKEAVYLMQKADGILSFALMSENVSNGNDYILSKIELGIKEGICSLKDSGVDSQNQEYWNNVNYLGDIISRGYSDDLRNCIDKIKEIIRKEVKYRIVFMPYKASMWESFETVWKCAVNDSRCDVSVISITYWEMDSQGNPVRKINERNLFPDYVDVINDEEYDICEDIPDIVYIHNIYNETNLITRVDKKYYTYNLKKYCDNLVYIPYYKWIEGVSSSLLDEGAMDVDYYILDSDKVIEDCKNHIYESADINNCDKVSFEENVIPKLVNLGCPAVDKVMSVNKSNMPIPKSWKVNSFDGKCVVLYNLTLKEIFKLQSFEKVRKVFNFFRNHIETKVIWRPHPLMRASLVSMLPDLVSEYDDLVDGFKNGNYGILDTESDMYYSFAWSDAYYGSRRSSLSELYRYTGKPVLADNMEIDFNDSFNENIDIRNLFYQNGILKEDEVSLPELVSFISKNEITRKLDSQILGNSGGRIHEFMIDKVCCD